MKVGTRHLFSYLWYHTFKKVLFLLIVCERNLQRSPVLQTNDLSRIIYIELHRNFLPKCFLFYRFENEYAETNIPIVPWQHTFGTNCKNPPKITFEKIVKLSGTSCVCNNLTSFEWEVHKNRKRK